MAKIHGAVVVNTERCKGCNLCVVACNFGVLDLQKKEVNNRGYHLPICRHLKSVLAVRVVLWCALMRA